MFMIKKDKNLIKVLVLFLYSIFYINILEIPSVFSTILILLLLLLQSSLYDASISKILLLLQR